MKGVIIFYMNFHPEYNQDQIQQIEIMKSINKDIIERMNKEGEYPVMIVPCTKEACRVEKVDFNKAFPRYSLKTHVEIDEDQMDRKRDENMTKLGE